MRASVAVLEQGPCQRYPRRRAPPGRSDTHGLRADPLRWEPRVDAAKIGIAVEDGVVTLTGSVDSWAEKWAAEHAAKHVAGVAAVVEHIEVRLPVHAQRTDGDIARAATNGLTWNAWVPADSVKVKVEDGWVTLEGRVAAQHQKRAAEEAIRTLTGVRGVTNLIDISPGARAGDVRESIRLAFERSASLDLGKIRGRRRRGHCLSSRHRSLVSRAGRRRGCGLVRSGHRRCQQPARRLALRRTCRRGT